MADGLILLCSGIVISTLVTALGIGGGILWTPLFILGFGLPPHQAVTTSLMIQVVGLGSGSIAYIKSGLVKTHLVVLIFIVALPGVIIGSILALRLPQQLVQMALGVMSLTLAILFVTAAVPLAADKKYSFDRVLLLKILPIPAFFGFMMGSLSVGISEWLVPPLRSRLGLSMPEAVASVIPVMFGLASIASLSHGLSSFPTYWIYFVWGAIGTIIGGQLGPRLAQQIDEVILKDTFIYLMTLVGIHLIFQSI
ncbi:hypothetical protein TI05_16750 [Achromatium sp. WMS3]|nr:hypothetical protein TI05_16750 [Achromatium sp. WMS3]